MDSSKRWNDAKYLTLLNKSFDVIKYRKIFGIVSTFRRIHPMSCSFGESFQNLLDTDVVPPAI